MVTAGQLFDQDEACRQTYPRETSSQELRGGDIAVHFGARLNRLPWAKSRHANDVVAVLTDGLETSEWNVHVGDHRLTHVDAVEADRHHYSKSPTRSSVDVYGKKTVAPK